MSKCSPEWWREYNKKRTAYRRAYYKKNRQKILDGKVAWVERNRERWERYHREYRDANRAIVNERGRKWGKANPQRVAAYSARRRERLREKCSNDPGILTFYELAHAQGDKRCYYCLRLFPGVADVDHVIPITRGGWHCSSNLCLSCGSCNRRKLNKLPSEFIKHGQLLFDC